MCCICGKEYEGYGYNPFPVKRRLLLPIVQLQCGRSGTVGNGTRFISAVRRPVPGRCTSAELSRIMTWMSAKEAFSRAEEELKAQGYDPVNPFQERIAG